MVRKANLHRYWKRWHTRLGMASTSLPLTHTPLTHIHTHYYTHTRTYPHTPGKRADPGAGAISTRQQPIHNPATSRSIGRGGRGQGRRRRFNADLRGHDDIPGRTAHSPNSPTASSRASFSLPFPPLLPVPACLPSAFPSLPLPTCK